MYRKLLQSFPAEFDTPSVHMVSRADYDLNRYYERRMEAILFLGGKCVDCSSTEMLQFDHVDSWTKTYEISNIILHGDQKLYSELQKCVLRCHSCHKNKTHYERSVSHGGGLSGMKNCKCIPCKARKAEYMRYYKKFGAMLR